MTAANDHVSRALDSLQRAVAETLERKRLLGQYAVIWREGKVVCVGPDAPAYTYPSGPDLLLPPRRVAEPDGR